jgi:mannose-6-phosphate isomerase
VTLVQPYPLVFEPALMPKVWGGDRLSHLGKAVKPGATIGESWEVADLAATSTSGAGGGSVRSVITNGVLKGRTLHDAMAQWGASLLGSAKPVEDGFPLLVKFLDARENLSVQVHPSPAYAAAHAAAKLKTECWYIVAADPGAVIYKGVKPGVTPESFARHIQDGTVVNDLISVPAVVGECHNLPSGTVHALGAGVLVAEVQTPSDTTFRVYDWGRAGRELHIRESLECIEFTPAPPPTMLSRGETLRTEFFEVSTPPSGSTLSVGGGRCEIVMVLQGMASLTWGDRKPLDLPMGATVLIPAALSGHVTASAQILRARL